MINFAIIGPGKIARKFAEDLRRVPGAQLFAVASNTLARAQEFAQQFNCPHVFGSYAQMLDFPDIDVVYIATPHVFHYEHTMMCLRKGHHVLCEKPFSMHPDQTREMIALAREKHLFLMEALWTLFHPAYNKALELARSGAIGQVHSAKADFSFFSPYNPQSRLFSPQLGGGGLLDIGIYPLLFFQDLFGIARPDDIQAAATLTRDGVDETCAFTIRYSDQQLAMGHCSIAANTPVEATIYGREGDIHLHSRFHHPTQLTIRHYLNAVTETIDLPYEGWGYQFEAAHVVQCLERGQTESERVPLAFTQGLTDTLQVILDKIGVRYH
jgi:predicted dehydrogenase